MKHHHEKAVITAKSIGRAGIRSHGSEVDGLFRVNQIMLPVKLADRR